MYTKNLKQLLRLLRSSRQSGLLRVESVDQKNAFWQGQFQLIEGNVVSCLIWRKTDRQILLKDDRAAHWLSAQDKLNWILEEETQPSEKLLPALPPRKTVSGERGNTTGEQRTGSIEQARWVPRHTAKGMRLSIQMLNSLEHRQIFALVNGHNTVEGISRLLHKSPDTIFCILNDFRTADLVE